MSKDLPSIPDGAGLHPDVRRAIVRMREELQGLIGTRGNDPAARLRQLTGAGAGGDVLVVLPGTGTGGGSGDVPDLTPPPTPTFGTGDAFGGIAQLIVTWAGIGYPQGHGNKQTVIYGVQKDPTDPTMPTFPGGAGIIAIAPHALTIIAIPSEPNIRWHLWLKFESVDGVLSTTPAGGTNGVQATTGQDPASLLAVLTGQIRESHLYRALGDPIRSIIERSDAAAEDTVATLVAAHESGRRARSALLAEAAARGTAITEVRQVVATGDAQLASQITTLTATVTSNRTEALAAVEDAAFAQAGVDSAQAGRLTALETSVDNPSTGLLVRAGVLETVTSNSTSGNGALATRTSTLEARVTTPSAVPGNPAFNTTYAALVAEASARATLDGNVRALYTVRAEVSAGGRTVVGGFGLAGTASATEGPRIDFGVRADLFWVGAPDDGSAPGIADVLPFIIQATPTTINGVAVPAGTYIADAFIRNGTITNVKIANAAIDDAKVANLSAAKVTFGAMSGDRIAVNTLHGNTITTNTLSANKLMAWDVTAGRAIIADATISTAKIESLAVKNAQIDNAAVTTLKLATGSAASLASSRTFPSGIGAGATFSVLNLPTLVVNCNAFHIVHLIGVSGYTWPATAESLVCRFNAEFWNGSAWATQNTGHCSMAILRQANSAGDTATFSVQYSFTAGETPSLRVKFNEARFYDATGATVSTTSVTLGECASGVFASYR